MTFLKRTGCLLLALLFVLSPFAAVPVLAVNNALSFTQGVGCSGVPMYSFGSAVLGADLVSGAVPPGMSWAAAGDALTISGTPSEPGTFGMEFTVSTEAEPNVPVSITVTVEPAPAPPHEHLFGSAWQTDALSHWHVCDCGERNELGPHTVANWITIRPSTATEQGERQGQCSVCGYTVVEALPLHTHSFSPVWQSNVTSHWHICDCGEQSDLGSHTIGSWTVVKAPTATELGQRQGSCTVCGYLVSEALPLHSHTFAGDWQHDSINHWQVCACGEKGNVAPHQGTDWKVVRESTTTVQGERLGKCSVCGATVSEALPLHSHAFTGDWQHDANEHWQLCGCGEKGNKAPHSVQSWEVTRKSTATVPGERKGTCSVCGATVTQPLELHVHNCSPDWKFDKTEHWHHCNCGEKVDAAAHVISEWVEVKTPTTQAEGERQGKCSVCGYTVIEILPVHTHSFDKNVWNSDNEKHWNRCSCGEKLNLAPHEVKEENWTVLKPATAELEGERRGKCSVCGALVTEKLPKLLPPTVTKQPTAEKLEVGGRAMFIAKADDVESYSWRFVSLDNSKTVEYSSAANYFTGLTVIGGNTDTMTISTVPLSLDGWKAVCRFRNANGDTFSEGALITVKKAVSQVPIITLQPKSVSAVSGDTVTLSVRALSPDGSRLVYQWYRSPDGTTGSSLPVSGATDPTYTPEERIGDSYYCVSIHSENATAQSDTLFSDLVCVTFTEKPESEPVHIHEYGDEWHHDDETHYHLCECGEHSGDGAHVFEWTEVRKAGKKSIGLRTGKCVVCGFEVREEIPATGTGRHGLLTFILVLLALLLLAAAALLLLKRRGLLTVEDEDDEDDEDNDFDPDDPDTDPDGPDGDVPFPGVLATGAALSAIFAAEAGETASEEESSAVDATEAPEAGAEEVPEAVTEELFEADTAVSEADPGLSGAAALSGGLSARSALADTEPVPEAPESTESEASAPVPAEAPQEPEPAAEEALEAPDPGSAEPGVSETAPAEAPGASGAQEDMSALSAGVLGAAALAGLAASAEDDRPAEAETPAEAVPPQKKKKKKPSGSGADDLSAALGAMLLSAENEGTAADADAGDSAADRSEALSALLDEMISASESSSRKTSSPAPGLAETSGGSYASPTGNIMSFSSSDPSVGDGSPDSES